MTPRRRVVRKKRKAEPSPIWHEWLVGVELVFLRLSPLYWGYGIPHGDGSAVILVPGFLSTDLYLTQFPQLAMPHWVRSILFWYPAERRLPLNRPGCAR